jgi:hypothetical protein
MDRALRDAAFAAQVTNYNANGDAADVAGAWTADVHDSAGVLLAGSPFAIVGHVVDSGVYAIAVPAQHALDLYTVTWNVPDGSKRTTQFEIVGGFYFSIAELRDGAKDLTATAFPAAKINRVRLEVEQRFEKYCRVAFVPRGRRVSINGTGDGKLELPDLYPRALISLSVSGDPFDAGELADVQLFETGFAIRGSGTFDWGLKNVDVYYEYGYDAPPEPIKAKAIKYARYLLAPHPFDDDRALSRDTGDSVIRYAVARNGSTGFPDIDAVLDAFGSSREGFA